MSAAVIEQFEEQQQEAMIAQEVTHEEITTPEVMETIQEDKQEEETSEESQEETTQEDTTQDFKETVHEEVAVAQMEQQQQMEAAEDAQKEVEKSEEEILKKEEEAVMEEVHLEKEDGADADAIAEVVVEEKKKGTKLFGADGRAARFYRSMRNRIGKSKAEKKEAAKDETLDAVVEEKTEGDTVEGTVEEKNDETAEEKVETEEKKEEEVVAVEEKKEEPKVTRRGTFYASVRARLARNKKTAEDKEKADTVVAYTAGTDEVTVAADADALPAADADEVPKGAAPTVEDAVAKEVEAGEHDAALDTTQDVVEKTALKTRFAARVRGFFRKSAPAPAATATHDATPAVTA